MSTDAGPPSAADRSEAQPRVRIVVAQPEAPRGPLARTLELIARLGPEVRAERVGDARACLELTRELSADLVLVDLDLGRGASEILLGLRASGPPVVALTVDASDEVARDAFRQGAADCVAAAADYARVLPVVALEQIRRWRALCERGEVERRLRSLEHLNDAIVRAIPAAVAVLSRDGRVVSVNPAFARAFGLPADGVASAPGAPVDRLLPAGLLSPERFAALLSDAETQPVELRVATPPSDGSARSFDLRLSRLDDDGRLLFVLWEVTEAEALNRRVAELQRYNENIIQNMNSALLVVDGDGLIVFANPTAEGILGVGPSELRGRALHDWFPGQPRGHELLERTLQEGIRFRGAETVITRPGGQVVPIGISFAPLHDGDGGRVGAVAIFQDLSEIKALQRHVLQTEKMASIGQLAAGVAHEINNPMGFIHANLCQMAEYLSDLRRLWKGVEELQAAAAAGDLASARARADDLSELSVELDSAYVLDDFAKALRESQEGSERIRHIVQDLRQFSRNDSTDRTLADVTECLDSTANIVWTMMKHTVVLRKDYAQLPRIRCYPMQLKQVFMNLLVNAFQAIQERVGASGQTGEIRLRTRTTADLLVVSVSDTGIGIPAANLDRIFDPFFTTKEVGIGTGLGLSTSFHIIQRHGGTLRVTSELGAGSTFEVVLPLAGGELAAEPLG